MHIALNSGKQKPLHIVSFKEINVSKSLHRLPLYFLYVNLLKPAGHVMHQEFNLLKPAGHVMHQV